MVIELGDDAKCCEVEQGFVTLVEVLICDSSSVQSLDVNRVKSKSSIAILDNLIELTQRVFAGCAIRIVDWVIGLEADCLGVEVDCTSVVFAVIR